MSLKRLLAIGTICVLCTAAEVTAQVHFVGNIEEQMTRTPQQELQSWFAGPSRVGKVIRSNDGSNFLRSASFRQFGRYQQPQGGSPIPPKPADMAPAAKVTPPIPQPTTVLPPASTMPGASQEMLPVSPAPTPIVSPAAPAPTMGNQTTPTLVAPMPQSSGAAVSSPSTSSANTGQTFGMQYTSPYTGYQAGSCGEGSCGTAMGSCNPGFQTGSCNPCGNQCNPCQEPCTSPCDRGCRSWTVETGAIFMFRSRPNRLRYIFNPLAPNPVMDASNFNFDMQTGMEVAATKHRAFGDWDFETRYFGIEDWSALQSRLFVDNPLQVATAVPTFVSGPRRVVSRYSSDLHNFEWNLTKPYGNDFNFLVGLRHLQINEKLMTRFRSTLPVPISTEDYEVRTRNRLYGLQIGLSKTLCADCGYCVEAYGKSGVYANDSYQRSALINYLNPIVEFADDARETELSFVNEIGLRTNYQICDNVSLYAGYRGLWVNNVALATDQISRTNFAGLESGVYNGGDLFYHGGLFGIEVWF